MSKNNIFIYAAKLYNKLSICFRQNYKFTANVNNLEIYFYDSYVVDFKLSK